MRTRKVIEVLDEQIRDSRLRTMDTLHRSMILEVLLDIRDLLQRGLGVSEKDLEDLLSHEKENSVPQHILDEASKKWHEENQKQENTYP
jgi:hypothetical protein